MARARRLALLSAVALSGCASVHTVHGDVDTLSFSPWLGLALLAVCLFLAVPGAFFLRTPPRPGAPAAPRRGGGLLLLLFGLAAAVAGVWRLSWRIDLHPDRIAVRSLFGGVSIPYREVQDVKVREYQNRWRPGTLWVTIVLVRTDGTEVALPYATLSAEHQKFLEDVLSAHHGDRGTGSEAPVVGGGASPDSRPPTDVEMEARPSVPCPILAGQKRAFCTVCSQNKRLDANPVPGFTCPRCHRRNELRAFTPPKLAFVGISEGKALVERDGVQYASGFGEEAVPGTGILNEGYRNVERSLILSRVEKVTFTDYRKQPPEEVTRDVKLSWELGRK